MPFNNVHTHTHTHRIRGKRCTRSSHVDAIKYCITSERVRIFFLLCWRLRRRRRRSAVLLATAHSRSVAVDIPACRAATGALAQIVCARAQIDVFIRPAARQRSRVAGARARLIGRPAMGRRSSHGLSAVCRLTCGVVIYCISSIYYIPTESAVLVEYKPGATHTLSWIFGVEPNPEHILRVLQGDNEYPGLKFLIITISVYPEISTKQNANHIIVFPMSLVSNASPG